MCYDLGMPRKKEEVPPGFTIVELLIAIVIIAILSGLTVVVYAQIRERAVKNTQQSELSVLKRAIMSARISADKPLREITGSDWTAENCVYIWGGGNTANIVPRLLAKTHPCWVDYYAAIDAIQSASGTNLQTFKKGDSNGNPYYIDENEEEPQFGCSDKDNLSIFTNNNADFVEEYEEEWALIPFYRCPS